MTDFSIMMGDLLPALGIQVCTSGATKHSVNAKCPFCEDTKYHLNVNLDGGVYRCVRCNTSGGVADLYARTVKGAPASSFTGKELFSEMKEFLYGKERKWEKPVQRERVRENYEIPCAPDAVLDKAFRTLLSFPPFQLSTFHKEKLLKRGLTERDVLVNGYRSLPVDTTWVTKSKLYPSLLKDKELLKLAKEEDELSKLIPDSVYACVIAGEYVAQYCDTKNVPGFFKLGQYNCFNLRDTSGIFIPTRNEKGEIVSMQIRTDSGSVRYMTVSSKKLGGPNVGISRIHFPISNNEIDGETVIFLTEGPLKADVALSLAKRLAPSKKFAFAAMHGINNTKQAEAFFKTVKGKRIYLAFDMDKCSNPFVLKGSKQIFKLATKAGVPMTNYCWDKETAARKCAEYDSYARKNGIKGTFSSCNTTEVYNLLAANTEVLFQAGKKDFDKSMWAWDDKTKGIDDYLLFLWGNR